MSGVFTQFGLRSARRRSGRTIATILGVALGVVMIVATRMASNAALASFVELVETAAGAAQLQVLPAAGSGFPEERLADVRRVQGVAGAYPLVTGTSPVVGEREELDSLLVLGVDPAVDREVRDYDFAEGRFFRGGDAEVLLAREWAAGVGTGVGDTVPLLTAEGTRDFTVAGLLSGSGVGTTNAGRVAIIPLARAQAMFSRQGRLDQIDVVVADEADLPTIEQALRTSLGDGLVVQRPASRGEDVADSLESFSILLSFTASISLFVGLLIIFNNMSVSVEERRYQVAMLRALGMRRRRALALMIGEALVFGVLGGLLGLVLGIGMAKVLTSGMAGLSESLSRVTITEVGLSAQNALLALVLGPLAAVLASLGPAWAILRVDPLEALAPADRDPGSGARRLKIAGWLLAVAGAAALAAFSAPSLFGLKDVEWDTMLGLSLAGFVLLTIGVILLLPGALGAALTRLRVRPVALRVAVDNLVRAPGRTSATVAGMMLALSIVVAVAAQSDAIERYALEWIDDTIGWDMLISSSFQGTAADVPVDPRVATWVSGSDRVAHAASLRFTSVNFRGRRVSLSAFDMQELRHFVRWSLADGDSNLIYERLISGAWVGVSQTVAARSGVKSGEVIELSTPEGVARLRVAGVIKDFTGDAGTIYIDQPTYALLWGDERIDGYDVKLVEGVEVSEVVDELRRAVGKDARLVVRTRAEFTEDVLGVVGQSMSLTNAIAYVAVLVAAAGIMNTSVISLMQRKRELSLLRAIGARKRAVGRVLLGESVILGLAGALLGGALGLVTGIAILRGGEAFAGVVYEFRAPWTALGGAVVLGVALGALASLVPRRVAARSDIVTGLRYE